MGLRALRRDASVPAGRGPGRARLPASCVVSPWALGVPAGGSCLLLCSLAQPQVPASLEVTLSLLPTRLYPHKIILGTQKCQNRTFDASCSGGKQNSGLLWLPRSPRRATRRWFWFTPGPRLVKVPLSPHHGSCGSGQGRLSSPSGSPKFSSWTGAPSVPTEPSADWHCPGAQGPGASG